MALAATKSVLAIAVPNILKAFLTITVAVLAMVCFVAVSLWKDMQTAMDRPAMLGRNGIDFVIVPGQSLTTVARNLARAGALEEPKYWVLEARRTRTGGRLQAGEYRIEPGQTPRMMLARFVAGDVQRYAITFIEGRTFREYLTLLAAHPKITRVLLGDDYQELMARINAAGTYPEGRFFPDTYFFEKGSTDIDIFGRAFDRMKQCLDEEWAKRVDGLPYLTSDDALIMASIVEKEATIREELTAIAGVYVRRLQRGMLMQADPTVIYGIGPAFDGDLRLSDLRNDTPYNTYVHGGLPPTPIANPGRAAIHASLHPQAASYLYFVARGDGRHTFSETYAEHSKAVTRYQR